MRKTSIVAGEVATEQSGLSCFADRRQVQAMRSQQVMVISTPEEEVWLGKDFHEDI